MSSRKRVQRTDEHGMASPRVAVVIAADARGDDRTVDMEPVRQLPASSTRSRRVLLVEPNDSRRFARAHALRSQHRVATAPAMAGALRLLSTEPFDVILVVEEPGCEAFALLETVTIMWPDTRRCLVASGATNQLVDAIAQRHVCRVYAKPFDMDVFFGDVRRRFSSAIDTCADNQQG